MGVRWRPSQDNQAQGAGGLSRRCGRHCREDAYCPGDEERTPSSPGERYAYNAHFVNRYNILRYGNGHADPAEFHRHQFDLQTGRETSKAIIGRHGMPTLGAFLTEVAQVIGLPIDDF